MLSAVRIRSSPFYNNFLYKIAVDIDGLHRGFLGVHIDPHVVFDLFVCNRFRLNGIRIVQGGSSACPEAVEGRVP